MVPARLSYKVCLASIDNRQPLETVIEIVDLLNMAISCCISRRRIAASMIS